MCEWHENEGYNSTWDGITKVLMMATSVLTGWLSKGINVRSDKPAE
jgi:hypothetical protein